MSEMIERVKAALVAELERQSEAYHAYVQETSRDVGPVDGDGVWVKGLTFDGFIQPQELARAAIEAMRDPILGVIEARRAVYEAKAAQRDPFEDDCSNRRDLSDHSREAMEHLSEEMRAALAPPQENRG